MRFVVTAGYGGSKAAIALSELLVRDGHEIDSVIVVTPWSFSRLKSLLASRGLDGLAAAVQKLWPTTNSAEKSPSVLARFLHDHSIGDTSLKAWCARRQVNFIKAKSINSEAVLATLDSRSFDAVIYAGGGILKQDFIGRANGGVINIHSGPLPEIRGMNAIEWAYLLNHRLTVTIHFIDAGIDTGKIIREYPLENIARETVESLREKAIVTGIQGLISVLSEADTIGSLPSADNIGAAAGRQCFVMSELIATLLQVQLAREPASEA